MYPHENKTFLKTDIQLQLKGADACLVAAARNLGLAVEVKPHYEDEPRSDDESDDAEDEDDGEDDAEDEDEDDGEDDATYVNVEDEDGASQKEAKNAGPVDYFGKSFGLRYRRFGDEDGCDDYMAVKKRVEPRRNVVWCHDIKPHAKAYARRYDNHSDSECDSDQGELAHVYIAYGEPPMTSSSPLVSCLAPWLAL